MLSLGDCLSIEIDTGLKQSGQSLHPPVSFWQTPSDVEADAASQNVKHLGQYAVSTSTDVDGGMISDLPLVSWREAVA